MPSSLQHISSLQHLAELRRSADEHRAIPRDDGPAKATKNIGQPRAWRGLRALRPAH